MDFDSLKNKWQSLSVDSETLERDNRRIAAELARGKTAGAQQRLARYHRNLGLKGLILPLLSYFLISTLHFPIWLAVVYGAFGVIMCFANLWLARTVAGSDYINMPVVSALRAVIRIRTFQRRIRTFGISSCFLIICSMASEILNANDNMLHLSFFVGILIGIIVAIAQCRHSRRLVADLQNQIKACTDGSNDEI